MIEIECPKCGWRGKVVNTTTTVELTGKIGFVSTQTGVKEVVKSNFDVLDAKKATNEFKCIKCGETIPKPPVFRAFCDSCGKSADVELVCLDTKRIKCFSCWREEDSDYCPKCGYRDQCKVYNTYKEML